jgi:CxxC-x17-CxxC domain-containing protein
VPGGFSLGISLTFNSSRLNQLQDGPDSNQLLLRGGHPVIFQDKSLQCSDCEALFIFSGVDQEYFKSKGYNNDPKRCPACRQARQTGNKSERSYAPKRELYPITCSQCGRDAKVPFEPRSGAPVYCSDCYSKVRVNR